MSKVYYNEMKCPDYEYKWTDGLQKRIDKNYERANVFNKADNERRMKDGMKDVHMYTPFKEGK